MAHTSSRDELEELSACMSGVSISRHQPKRLQSTTTPASAARPRAVRKLHDDWHTDDGSDVDVDSNDKENARSTPVQGKQTSAEEITMPQGVTPSRLACLGDLKDELTCCICLDICVRPVTTPCGHNFCRACLTTAQQHSNTCAKCREVLPRDFSMKVNTALWNTIRLLFPAVGMAPLTPVALPPAQAPRRTINSSITAGQAFRRPRSIVPSQPAPAQQQTFNHGSHLNVAGQSARSDPHSQLDRLLQLLDTEPDATQPLGGRAFRSSHSGSSTAHAVWPALRPLTSSIRAQSAVSNRPATVSASLMYSQMQPLSVGAAVTNSNNNSSSSSRNHGGPHPQTVTAQTEVASRASAVPTVTRSVSLFRRIPEQRAASEGVAAASVAVSAPPPRDHQVTSSTSRSGLLQMLSNNPTYPSNLDELQQHSQAITQILDIDLDTFEDLQGAQASGYSVSSARNLLPQVPHNPFLRGTLPANAGRNARLVGMQQQAPIACYPAHSQQLQQQQENPQDLQQQRPFARPSLFQRQPLRPTSSSDLHSANQRIVPPRDLVSRPSSALGSGHTSYAMVQPGLVALSQAKHPEQQQQQEQWGDASDSTQNSDVEDNSRCTSDNDVILLPTPQPLRVVSAFIPPARHVSAILPPPSIAEQVLLPPAGRQSHLRDIMPRRAAVDQTEAVSQQASHIRFTAGLQSGALSRADRSRDSVAEDTRTPVRDQSRAARPFVRSPDSPSLAAAGLPGITNQSQQQHQAAAQQHWHQLNATGTAGWETASNLYAGPASTVGHSTMTLMAFTPVPAGPSGHSTHTVSYCSEDDEEMITLDSLDLLSSPGNSTEHRHASESPLCLSDDDTDVCHTQPDMPCQPLTLPSIGVRLSTSVQAAEQHSTHSVLAASLLMLPEVEREEEAFVLFRGGEATAAARYSSHTVMNGGSLAVTNALVEEGFAMHAGSTQPLTSDVLGLALTDISMGMSASARNTIISMSAQAPEQAPPLRQSARLVPGLRRPSAHASSRC